MGDETKIQWAHHTFNPVIGCDEAVGPDGTTHPACDGCYAREGFGTMLGGRWGSLAEGGVRRVTSDDNWAKPKRWARAAAKAGERHRVFCASLADVLDTEWPAGVHDRLWQLIRETAPLCTCGPRPASMLAAQHAIGCKAFLLAHGGLDWLLLTKRPERWEMIPADIRPLVWLGTSISDQATADVWVPRLLAAEGFRCRFVSVEPMLAPVDLTRVDWDGATALHTLEHPPRQIDWVIIGGESGSRGWDARPFPMEAARDLIGQCKAAGVPVFMKQTGEVPVMREETWRACGGRLLKADNHERAPAGTVPLFVTGKGGDPAEWPPEFRVREFPTFQAAAPPERAVR